MVTPRLRRALHDALDMVLDALAEERAAPPKVKRTRTVKEPVLPKYEFTPEERARAREDLERQGWRIR